MSETPVVPMRHISRQARDKVDAIVADARKRIEAAIAEDVGSGVRIFSCITTRVSIWDEEGGSKLQDDYHYKYTSTSDPT